MKLRRFLAVFLVAILVFCAGCAQKPAQNTTNNTATSSSTQPDVDISLQNLPAYSGDPFVAVHDNIPYFTDAEKQSKKPFETYTSLDKLGRCGVAYACVCKELMPTEKRGNISSVKPTGWQNRQYDFVDGKSLYNRCHLIGFQLAGENANERNLITGTRYMNVDGMLPFENMVADYVKETGGHVLYRVTPVFTDQNLLADGVLMEAWSVEDGGESVCYCVFCYNVQPKVTINYKTGENRAEGVEFQESGTFVLNTKTKKFHRETCNSANEISKNNYEVYTGNRQDLIDKGYSPCGSCQP